MTRDQLTWLQRAIAWLGRAWRTVLEEADLLGTDGRPSSTKLAAVATLWVMLYIAMSAKTVSAGVATLIICAFAVLFGRRYFGQFLERWSAKGELVDRTERRDETRVVDETRRTIESRRAIGAEDGSEPT